MPEFTNPRTFEELEAARGGASAPEVGPEEPTGSAAASATAPGEAAEHELDAFIVRAARKREEELGESPERARANAEWEALEEAERLRAESKELENQNARLMIAQQLRRVYASRFREYSRLVRMLEGTQTKGA